MSTRPASEAEPAHLLAARRVMSSLSGSGPHPAPGDERSQARAGTAMNVQRFRAYIHFDASDEERLRALWPHVEPHLDAICDTFYRRAMAEPVTRSALFDAAQVARLMATLRIWLRELHNGPWDEQYAERRRRIGAVHVAVGVAHDAMFAAMSVIREHLTEIACAAGFDSGTVQSIGRVTSLDLALMTARYHEARESQAVQDTQALLISRLPSMVLLVTPDLTITEATPSVGYRFGITDVSGRRVTEVLPARLVEEALLEERLRNVWASNRAVTVPRVDVEVAGELLHLAVSVVPVRRSSPLAMVHIDDHTLSVRNETLLRRQESLAQLGSLSATIAHELRNPLAGISGALQVISRQMKQDERFAPIFGKVIDQVRSLNRLADDLLAFARPRDPQLVQQVEIGAIARDVIALLRADFPAAEVEVIGDAQQTTDPDLVRQILANLVMNALQAIRGAGTVRVHINDQRIVVEDDGPGLAPEIAGRLFEPFRTTKIRGTGLGLSVSQRMAHAMGCTLRHLAGPTLPGAAFELRFETPHD